MKFANIPAAALVFFCSFTSGQSINERGKVLIRIEVDYDRKTEGALTPAELAKWSNKQRIVRAFENPYEVATIGQLLRKNLTKTNPDAFERAFELNTKGIDLPKFLTASELKPLWLAPLGTAKILPQKNAKSNASFLSTYRPASYFDLSRVVAAETLSSGYDVLVPDRPDDPSGVPRRRVIQYEVSREVALELQRDNPKASVKLLNGVFMGTFSGVDESTVNALEEKLQQTLGPVLEGRVIPKVKPLLIILDDSWPDDESFRVTKNLIGSIFPELWKSTSDLSSRTTPPQLPDNVKRMESPGVPADLACGRLDTCDTHAKRVSKALFPLRRLARHKLGDEPVDIMYLPLNASQDGARDILKMLWNLGYATGTSLAPNSPTFFSEESTRIRQEREFLGTLQTKFSQGHFISNWGILEGVSAFARLYARARQVPVYINLSWTTEDISYNPPPLPVVNVLIVAAAGNHCSDGKCGEFSDELGPPRLFTSRAEYSSDILLVVNLDQEARLTCQSTRVRTSFMVVGFDGSIPGDCGTSYSAPRVAWLLATRAALSTLAPTSKEQVNRLHWLKSLQLRKNCVDDDYSCVRLDTVELMKSLDNNVQKSLSTKRKPP